MLGTPEVEPATHHKTGHSLACEILAAVFVFAFCPAMAEPLKLSSPITNFAPSALGGIRTIVSYETAHPNQIETDYLLLAEPSADRPDALPVAIQVQDSHGNAVKLADTIWGDCTIARTAIFRQGREVALVKAVRSDDTQHVMAGSLSQAGLMSAQIYRRREGGDGESSPLFKADGPPVLSKPLCEDSEVQQFIDETAKTVFKSGLR